MIRLTAVLACVAMLTLAPEAIAATRTVKVITHNIAGAYKFDGQLTAVTPRCGRRAGGVQMSSCSRRSARRRRAPFETGSRVTTTCSRPCAAMTAAATAMGPLRTRGGLEVAAFGRDPNQPAWRWRLPPGEERSFWLTCALVAAPGVPAGRLRACVTHLRAGNGADQPSLDTARTAQVHRIHRALHDDIVAAARARRCGGRFQHPTAQTRTRRDVQAQARRRPRRRRGLLRGRPDGPPLLRPERLRAARMPQRPTHVLRRRRRGSPGPGTQVRLRVVFRAGVSRLSGLSLGLGGSDHALYRARARFEF